MRTAISPLMLSLTVTSDLAVIVGLCVGHIEEEAACPDWWFAPKSWRSLFKPADVFKVTGNNFAQECCWYTGHIFKNVKIEANIFRAHTGGQICKSAYISQHKCSPAPPEQWERWEECVINVNKEFKSIHCPNMDKNKLNVRLVCFKWPFPCVPKLQQN